jgi:toxin HigB-1
MRYALQCDILAGFRHKGLKRLFERDDSSGIRADLVDKIRTILSQLDEAQTIEDMRMTSFHLHALKASPTALPMMSS